MHMRRRRRRHRSRPSERAMRIIRRRRCRPSICAFLGVLHGCAVLGANQRPQQAAHVCHTHHHLHVLPVSLMNTRRAQVEGQRLAPTANARRKDLVAAAIPREEQPVVEHQRRLVDCAIRASRVEVREPDDGRRASVDYGVSRSPLLDVLRGYARGKVPSEQPTCNHARARGFVQLRSFCVVPHVQLVQSVVRTAARSHGRALQPRTWVGWVRPIERMQVHQGRQQRARTLDLGLRQLPRHQRARWQRGIRLWRRRRDAAAGLGQARRPVCLSINATRLRRRCQRQQQHHRRLWLPQPHA
mmetsp:Transcript_3203/g.8891  ORF Transcript_3203/g.8891 Transcript_3203/m.8891 type:complete len:300 (+) Transcript_3203:1220-2119(+)